MEAAGKPEIGRRVSFAPDVPENTGMKKKQLSRTRSEIQRIFAQNLEAGKVRKALSSGDESSDHQDEAKPLRLNLPTSVPPAASSDPGKKTRFNTKWSLPSHQKVIFNYTAKNIPDTPGSTRASARKKLEMTRSDSSTSAAASPDQKPASYKKKRVLIPRRQSSFLREKEERKSIVPKIGSVEKAKTLLRRQTSGGTAMFPAESYDAVYGI